MTNEEGDPIQRWSAKRRTALVLTIVKGETSVVEAARAHGLTVAEVEDWQQRFNVGAENALRTRPKDEEAVKDEQIKKLKQKVGDLVLDNDLLREALKTVPFGPEDVRRVNEAHPDVSERRVCWCYEWHEPVCDDRPHTQDEPLKCPRDLGRTAAHVNRTAPDVWVIGDYGHCCGLARGYSVNRKAVYRILRVKHNGWSINVVATARPRAQRLRRSGCPRVITDGRWRM
jgi:transposase-like protein